MRDGAGPGSRDAPLLQARARSAGIAVEAVEIGSATVLTSAERPHDIAYNRAFDVDAREPGVAAHLVAHARAGGRRPLMEIVVDAMGDAQRADLVALGLARLWDVVTLRLDLEPPLPAAPPTDAIVRLALPAEAEAFAALAVRAVGAPPPGLPPSPPDADRVWAAICRLGIARCYFAERGGVPCAIAMSVRAGALEIVDGAATLPEHRGHGCQAVLLSRRFHDARAEGVRVAVTRAAAGSPSHRNLERAGMRVWRRMEVWGTAELPC
jgi:GNAT superfamily N-acetyltransferase